MDAARITVYSARRIHTLDPARPAATHVAVREGRVLGVGTLQDLRGWGPHDLDERFVGQVSLPGLVEGHSHLIAGGMWRYVRSAVPMTPSRRATSASTGMAKPSRGGASPDPKRGARSDRPEPDGHGKAPRCARRRCSA